MGEATESARTVLEQRRYSERTIESYTYWISRLEEFYSGSSLNTLTDKAISSFFKRLDLSTRTIRQAVSAISFYYREIARDPSRVSAVPRYGYELHKPEIPTQKEIFLIISHVKDIKSRVALKCIYGMGLELNDILIMRVKQINLAQRTAKVIPQRGKLRTRTAPLPTFALEEMGQIIADLKADDHLISAKKGGRISDKKLQRDWTNARKESGISSIYNIRSLRHAYVRHLEHCGVRLRDILLELGVSPRMSLDYYTSLQPAGPPIDFSPADRLIPEAEERHAAEATTYVAMERLEQLNELRTERYDLVRLITLLREINCANNAGCLLSIAMLCRAVIDHVPPIFEARSFAEVANSYSGGKSFKRSMKRLHQSLRDTADTHLHVQIRATEDIPTFVQVDFRSDLDALLGEIIRKLRFDAQQGAAVDHPLRGGN